MNTIEKLMNKKWLRITVIIVAGLFALSVIKNVAIKWVVEIGAGQVTGAPVKIKSLQLGLLTQSVKVKGLKVYNPKGFSKGVMVDISEVRADLNGQALFGGKLHLLVLVFNMKEMVVVKNSDGQLNVDALKFSKETDEKKEKKVKKKKAKKPMPMRMDEVRLNIDRIVYKNYSEGEPPAILVYESGLKDKVFKNVNSPAQLGALILVNGLGTTAIKGAKIYTAAAVLGVGFMPAGVVGALVAKDHAQAEFHAKADKVFAVGKKVLGAIGEIKSEDKQQGVIKADTRGNDITLKIEQADGKGVTAKVSARKMMLPKPEVAAGILYQIDEHL